MMKKKKKKKFKKHGYVSYIDAVVRLDWDLIAIAELCQGASEKLDDPIDTLNWVGEVIEKHVNKNRILRCKHFDEPLDFRSEIYLSSEREKLQTRSDNRERKNESR